MKSYLTGLCYLLFFSSTGIQSSQLDSMLEQLSNTSIAQTREIIIPEYPGAYNPSLISYEDGYLLSFRLVKGRSGVIENSLRLRDSFIGVVKLDQQLNVLEETAQILEIASYSPDISITVEDVRLFNSNGRIFIIFNDIPPLGAHGNSMYLGELNEENGNFVLKEPAKFLNYPFAKPIEKNWTPFVFNGKIYVIYSEQPRVVLEVDVDTGNCQEVSRLAPHWNWNFGEIRGGTIAYPVNETFLTFFHSSFFTETSIRKAYVMGAYTFDKDPPFLVRTITPAPLGDLTYYEDNSSNVVFPGGMVVEDHFIFVAWGKGDKQIMITTFDREKLLASMDPFKS